MIRAARIFVPTSSLRLALMDASLVVGVFYVLVRLTVIDDPAIFFLDDRGALKLAPLIVTLLAAMYFSGLYGSKRIGSRIFLAQQLVLSCGVTLVSQAAISYLFAGWILPHLLALYGLLISLLVLLGWRLLRDAMLSRLEGTGTILILGTDDTGHRIARHVAENPAQHLRVVGSLTNRRELGVSPVLGGLDDLTATVKQVKPDLIISGLVDARDRMPVEQMVELRYRGTRIEEAGMACELICRHVSARDLRPSRVLFSQDFDVKSVPLALFLMDKATALLLLVLGLPFALIYAALLVLKGGGPVLEREVCSGFEGKVYRSVRFHVADTGALAGFARALHLDGWPQLRNVLTGRMSMVGPRPLRVSLAAELDRLLPVHEYRLNAKPGITGWAQINLRDEPEPRDAIAETEFDLYYVRYQSVSLYTYILLHGFRAAI